METGNAVKIVTAILALLGVLFLATSVNISPMRGTQEVMLEFLRAPSANVAYAGQSRGETFTVDSSMQVAKDLGRAAGKKGESREEKEIYKFGKPAPRGLVRKRSKVELLDRCNKLARCKAKLRAAKMRKRPFKVLRSTKQGESPEEKARIRIPKPIKPKPRFRRQKSELMQPEERSPLFSWLNPLAVTPAHAQSAFSLYLTPENRFGSNPHGYIDLYGIAYWGSYFLYSTSIAVKNTNSENKPYVYLQFMTKTEGWYLINFQGGRGKAKLRHRNAGPIIETWDFMGTSCNPCDYLTSEYLTAGYHYFYFWPDGSNIYFYSASVESY